MMASCNRMTQLGAKPGILLYKLRSSTINRLRASANSYNSLSSNSSDYQLDYKQISPNEKRIYPFDTHALIRSLEAQGVPTKQAEAMTSAVTLILNVNSEYTSQNFTPKAEMLKFKSEVRSSLDHQFLLQQREADKLRNDTEKMHGEQQRETDKLRNDIEKMGGELRYEIDKVTAGQRLDLNLEKRHIRDELANLSAQVSNLENKLDKVKTDLENKLEKETHASMANLVAAKYDMMKYWIGAHISLSAVFIGLFRIFTTK